MSKGKFSNLCLRFAEDFENSLDDWKPDMTDSSIMNLCVVSDGTYEVCSRTIAAKQPNGNLLCMLPSFLYEHLVILQKTRNGS